MEPFRSLPIDPTLWRVPQGRFSNLRTLKIDFRIDGLANDEHDLLNVCCIAPSRGKQLIASLADATVRIKADKVDVLVQIWGTQDKHPDMCDCLKPLAEYIEKMARKKG
jgi:hypothetical protein